MKICLLRDLYFLGKHTYKYSENWLVIDAHYRDLIRGYYLRGLVVPPGYLEIRTLTPNRFKNKTNDNLKLLDDNRKPSTRVFQTKNCRVQ